MKESNARESGKVREKVLVVACKIIIVIFVLQFSYGLGPKWCVRKQGGDEFDQLVDLKVHKCPLFEEVGDVGHVRFKQLGEIRELEPRRNVGYHGRSLFSLASTDVSDGRKGYSSVPDQGLR